MCEHACATCGDRMHVWSSACTYARFRGCIIEATFSALHNASSAHSKTHVDQLPDRPLNPPPGTLTASPWEADLKAAKLHPPPQSPQAAHAHVHVYTAAAKRPYSYEELAARSVYQLPLMEKLLNL